MAFVHAQTAGAAGAQIDPYDGRPRYAHSLRAINARASYGRDK